MFPNAKPILKAGLSLDSYKLLLMAAVRSRPKHKKLCMSLLSPFVEEEQIRVCFRAFGRQFVTYVRMGEVESDWMSINELGIRRIYRVEPLFAPDLIIDGGGNTGIFTLMASAAFASARILTCEPVPANIAQIRKHLQINGVNAEILPVCIGGSERSMPFYVREANQGSFDPERPYRSIIHVNVATLAQLASRYPAKRVLVKLDIEGMEVEALRSYLPEENRPVCVLGELHDHRSNGTVLRALFEERGWTVHFTDVGDAGSNFDAWSPAAIAEFPAASEALAS